MAKQAELGHYGLKTVLENVGQAAKQAAYQKSAQPAQSEQVVVLPTRPARLEQAPSLSSLLALPQSPLVFNSGIIILLMDF